LLDTVYKPGGSYSGETAGHNGLAGITITIDLMSSLNQCAGDDPRPGTVCPSLFTLCTQY